MKAIPHVSKFMTTTPHSINSESLIEEAMDVMSKNKIRHLPVMKDGKVLGMVSDRDVKSVLSFAGANPKQIKVGDICNDMPYLTKPTALISEVAAEMAEKKLGSALVLDNNKLVGIFTATDACQALSEICQLRFH